MSSHAHRSALVLVLLLLPLLLFGQSSGTGSGSSAAGESPRFQLGQIPGAASATGSRQATDGGDQQRPTSQQPGESVNRVVLANATEEYPVTPGDVYALSYRSSTQTIEVTITVPPSRQIDLNVFGSVDARGMTFRALEAEALRRVRNSYTDSFPRMEILQVGQFRVSISGEVTETQEVTAWGLSRLSEVIGPYLTPYSSHRDIEVRRAAAAGRAAAAPEASEAAEATEYDLYEARRQGNLSQDPYVLAGDEIVVKRLRRRVSITGNVERPGSYQLLEGEQLDELIGRYANGFTAAADTSRIRIQSCLGEMDCDGEARYVSYLTAGAMEKELFNNDQVQVPSRDDYLPYVIIEGALAQTRQGADGTTELSREMTTYQIRRQIREGDRLSTILRSVQSQFLPVADLKNAFLERAGEPARMPIDIEALLYSGEAPESDILLEPDDRIVIPFRQFFVTVSGAVASPGQYPYIPDRTFRYYLGLAGGINPDRRIGVNPRIRDIEGTRRPDGAIIQPEDNIHFGTNNPVYYLRFITPVLSVLSTALSTWAVINTM